jgi:hypothetical protein
VGGKKRADKESEKMDEMKEEEHSPLISVMSNLDSEMSPSKPDEQSTQDDRELNSNEGIYEVMV